MVTKIKYPRTFHFPWSEGICSDDKTLKSLDGFSGKNILVSCKLDGENSTLYSAGNGFHARSLDSRHHPSRDWLAKFHGSIAHNIPENWRVCGENLYAKHSLGYDDLPSYFMGFSIWNADNICLSWPDTLEWFELIGITPVPVLWQGVFDESVLKQLAKSIDPTKEEGFVVRISDAFPYADFNKVVGKYVRANHVQTSEHWMSQTIIPNKLKLV